jgi:integrase
MARKSSGARFYASKDAYFANINGERIRLLDGPKSAEKDREAQRLYENIRKSRSVQKYGDRAECQWVLNEYLNWCRDRTEPPALAPGTYERHHAFVQSFIDMFGDVTWRDLLPTHFDQWLRVMKGERPRTSVKGRAPGRWGPGTVKLAMTVMRTACAYASTVGGLVAHNPLKIPGAERLRTKKVNYRGKRFAITDDEHRELLAHSLRYEDKDFACILMLWYATGSRPGEVARARAEWWDPARHAIVIQPDAEGAQGVFKLARHGEERVIRIPTYLGPLVELLLRRRPSGLLFRTMRGGPFNKLVITKRFQQGIRSINRKAGREVIRVGVSAYAYRHAFVTRWVKARKDPMYLCELLNTSLEQLHKTYSKLFKEHEALQATLDEFSAGESGAGSRKASGASVPSAEGARQTQAQDGAGPAAELPAA